MEKTLAPSRQVRSSWSVIQANLIHKTISANPRSAQLAFVAISNLRPKLKVNDEQAEHHQSQSLTESNRIQLSN